MQLTDVTTMSKQYNKSHNRQAHVSCMLTYNEQSETILTDAEPF